MKKIILGLFAIVILLTLYLLPAREQPAHSPTTTPANKFVAAEGKVEVPSGNDVEVGSEITARITELLVKRGEHVNAGQLIARLESSDLRARLNQAEAELTVALAMQREVASGARKEEISKAAAGVEHSQAELDIANKELTRYQELFRLGQCTAEELDRRQTTQHTAKARLRTMEQEKRLLDIGPKPETLSLRQAVVQSAQANVKLIQTLLDKTSILAPISGQVLERYHNAGEVITPEIPILSIARLDKLRINAEVDETDIGLIHIGDPTIISLSGNADRSYQGKVSEIADYVGRRQFTPGNPAVNLGMKVVQVKIEPAEPIPMKLGMTVDIKIQVGKN